MSSTHNLSHSRLDQSNPGSPRQPTSATSKIPRRRPSTQLGEATRAGGGSGPRAVSTPAAPVNGRAGAEEGARGGHSRKSSRSALGLGVSSAALPTQHALSDTLQERRRTSMSGAPAQRPSGQPEMRRTPSLSIYIPSTPSASPSVPRQDDPCRRPPPTFQSPISAGDRPTASPSAPHPAHQPRRCSRFGRPPRTPYPHLGQSPQTPHMSEHSPHPRSHGPHARHLRSPSASSILTAGTTYTYTSFDLQHPRTPREEREESEALARAERERRGLGLLRWLWRGRREARTTDEESGVDERSALLRRNEDDTVAEQDGRSNEITKWEYVWSETVCYAKVRLPFFRLGRARALTGCPLASTCSHRSSSLSSSCSSLPCSRTIKPCDVSYTRQSLDPTDAYRISHLSSTWTRQLLRLSPPPVSIYRRDSLPLVAYFITASTTSMH